MNIHEYQTKNLLKHYGILSPDFRIATNAEEVLRAIKELGLEQAVLKIQVHAGGRGKAGGVKIAKNQDEVIHLAEQMIGMKIVNNQTGPDGVVANKILLSAVAKIKREFYVAATIDRSLARPIFIVSPEGGTEIEEIAAKNPERILKQPFGIDGKIRGYQLLRICKFLGWEGDLREKGKQILRALSHAFIENDASLIEINPLIETDDGKLLALDAKCSIDDNALFRHGPIAQWYDPTQLSKSEMMAREFDLSYVGLKGEIGCMVNGAGLAMATMDIIHHYGGRPANFLDVGGGATKEKVAHGFKIILLDAQVKAIFVNIFGGIMDCGIIAQGIVEATKEDHIQIPLIVRMEGTNVDQGKKILSESGLKITSVETMADGALEAVKIAGGGNGSTGK